MLDRRDFIRIVVTGSLGAAACRVERGAPDAPPGHAAAPASTLRRDAYEVCHWVRDGADLRLPPPSRHVPIVIAGGGSAGLFTARELGDLEWLLLEKEPVAGGNAIGGSWRGVGYSAGTSYNNDRDLLAIAEELGVPMRPIDSVDGLILGDQFIPEFLTSGLDKAPFPPAVRDGFRRFFKTYRAYDVDREVKRLDNLPFDAILKDYPSELREFFDAFGPNSWAGRVEDTSAYVGIQGASWVGGVEEARYTGDQGFGGLTQGLAARLAARGPGRIVTGATVVRVQKDGDRVLVAWVPPAADGAPGTGAPGAGTGDSGGSHVGAGHRLECVSADTVVVAAPKFIARRLVAGLPADQLEAMGRIRYIPYIVANLCFEGVVHESCFDTNVLRSDVLSDVVCAEFPRVRGRGPKDRPTVLTCYIPLREPDRAMMFFDDEVGRRSLAALDLIDRCFPGATDRCREIRAHVRGHPMHLSTCGMITRWGPLSRRSHGAVHFAGTDGVGAVSDLATSLVSARAAARAAIASLDAAARRRG